MCLFFEEVKERWEHCTEMESSSCWIFQSKCGCRVSATLVFEGIVSVEIAEARAVLEGLLGAVDNGWFPVLIESNVFGIVNFCTQNLIVGVM